MGELHEAYVKDGLKINFSKTMWMRNRFSNEGTITVSGQTIEEVDNYVTLGYQINLVGGC